MKWFSIGLVMVLLALLITFMPVEGISINSEGYLCIDMNVTLAAQVGQPQFEIAKISDIPAYGVIEPSGCGEYKGKVKIRIDVFMTPDAPYYDEFADVPFHSHFIYFGTNVTDAEIKAKIIEVTEYFYAFHTYCGDNNQTFLENWVKVPKEAGTIRDVFVEGAESQNACETKVDDILARIAEFDTRVFVQDEAVPQDLNIGDKGTIDIGAEAINRSSYTGGGTFVEKENPANETGAIDTIEIYLLVSNSIQVATFEEVSANTFTSRDEENLGSVSAGYHEITGLYMDVETGDYLGFYCSSSYAMEKDNSGDGYWYASGDQIPCTSTSFTFYSSRTISLYGTGTGATYPGRVGTTLDDTSIRVPPQRNCFYDEGLFWIFYDKDSAGDDLVYKTSSNGSIDWSEEVGIATLPNPLGANFDIFFDGTYVHYVRNLSSDPNYLGVAYRRGEPQSDGTISWSAAEQTVLSSSNYAEDISVIVDSNGYPWVGYGAGAIGDATVTKSSTNDGTWSTESGYPLLLKSGTGYMTYLVPQTNGKVCALIYKTYLSSERIEARFYNGSSWESIEYVTASGDEMSVNFWAMLCAVGIDDEIHLVYHQDTTDYIQYLHGHHGSWGSETTIDSSISTGTSPVIGKDGSNLYVFWLEDDDHVYYRKYNGSSWDSIVDWKDETTEDFTYEYDIQCFYEEDGGYIGVCYQTLTSSPYYVKFAFIEISCSEDITNSPSSWSVNGGTPVAANSTYTTGLTYFTVTNNSGGAVDISISGTDMTGGNTWTLSDTATPGNMVYGLKAGLSGGDYTIIVKKSSPFNDLVTGLADSGTQDWGLKLYTPTVYTDGIMKTGTVTIIATCS